MAEWVETSVNVGPTVFYGEIRGHRTWADVPADLGGHDAAPMPPETLLTALGNCMGMVIALSCKAHGVPYEGMRLDVAAEVVDKENRLDNFRLTIHMPGELDEHGRKVVEAAQKLCKVGNTLMHGVKLETTIAE